MINFKTKILFFVTGLIVLSFGISLTIKADLGAGAWDALNVGLSSLTGLTVGNWVIIMGVILMVVNALIGKERPDLFSLITIFVIGFMIDFWLLIVMTNWHLEGFLIQGLSLMVGIVILGFGVSLYLQPKLSLNPVDGLMVALQKRFKINLLTAKTITEVFALLLAILLGGPIGIGTFIILLCIGPVIQLFEPFAKKMLNKFTPVEAIQND
ncbi:YczE/YyaS/YitT family protein [Aquibacillus rhizosphaerae]|uniref:Membrane protein n=1 Tax=Aquibacillus rhizosphaerae TaxID=3051431 RepID=A0ABT7L7J9_9BACI|nr:membrane protein [Aquibacillus sp. LR5S19]MDL4841833.1 membrane protein [Aquibacillus sp. LR5S19]